MKITAEQLNNKEFLEELATIINRGNEAKIKRERDRITLVEVKRDLRSSINIENN